MGRQVVIYMIGFLMAPAVALWAQDARWVRHPKSPESVGVKSLQMIADSQLVIGGEYADTLFLQNDTIFSDGMNPKGGSDAFIMTLDRAGQLNQIYAWGDVDTTTGDCQLGKTRFQYGEHYITGTFSSTLHLGSDTLQTNPPGNETIYLSKMNSDGTFQWSRKAGGPGQDVGQALVVDDGKVYIAGSVTDSARFGGFTVDSAGSRQFYVTRYDTSGTVTWVQYGTVGNIGNIRPQLAGLDSSLVLLVHFRDSLVVDTHRAYSRGNIDIALLRLDPGTGAVRQIGTIGGSNADRSTDMIGGDSLVWLTGRVSDTIWLNDQPVPAHSSGDLFWTSWDAGNNFQRTMVSQTNTFDQGDALAIDGAGSLYLAGLFVDSLSIDSITVQGDGLTGFVLKRFPKGPIQWIKKVQPDLSVTMTDLVLDSQANSYLTGTFRGDSMRLDSLIVTPTYKKTLGLLKDNAFAARIDCWVPQPKLITYDSLLCKGDSVRLAVVANERYSYTWNAQKQDTVYWVSQAGNHTVRAVDRNGCTSDPLIVPISAPEKQGLSLQQQCDTLRAPDDYDQYNWYRGDTLLRSTTNAVFVVPESGNYHVTAYPGDGCPLYSDTLFMTFLDNGGTNRIYPNPVRETLHMQLAGMADRQAKVMVYTPQGERVYTDEVTFESIGKQRKKQNCKQQAGDVGLIHINFGQFKQGLYIVKLKTRKRQWQYKFVKF